MYMYILKPYWLSYLAIFSLLFSRFPTLHSPSAPREAELHTISTGAAERHLQTRQIPQQHPEAAGGQACWNNQGSGQSTCLPGSFLFCCWLLIHLLT